MRVHYGDKAFQEFESPHDVCKKSDTLQVNGLPQMPYYDISSIQKTQWGWYTFGALVGGTVGFFPGLIYGLVYSIGCDTDDKTCSSSSILIGMLGGVIIVGALTGEFVGTSEIPVNSIPTCQDESAPVSPLQSSEIPGNSAMPVESISH